MTTQPANIIGGEQPADSDQWTWECQCARCGSSIDRTRCDNCEGDGFESHYETEGYEAACHICNGNGRWWTCLSSKEYCQANPLPGREAVASGTVEWYPTPADAAIDGGA